MDTSRVFHHFYEISKIPRGSGNEKGISNYLVNFAKVHGLEVIQDEYYNVLIRKKATKGYEKYKSICLQGHMDMVCEKDENKVFDFKKDPIEIIIQDGYLTANGTTLGADNGISVAICMAILESDKIKHPDLEILLTTDEEVGMVGAKGFDITNLESNILVNIDSEEYGCIYVSSAGSSMVKSSKTFNAQKIEKDVYEVKIDGLFGGHSGVDIHLNTANASMLLAELMLKLANVAEVNILDFNGGTKDNTIPRSAKIVFSTDMEYKELEKLLNVFLDSLRYRYIKAEKNILMSISKLKDIEYTLMLNKEDSKNLLNYLMNMPNGVLKMSDNSKDLVESSSNMGIVYTEEINGKKLINTHNAIRSLKIEYQDYVAECIKEYAKSFGFDAIVKKSYNPWEYKEKSEIRDYFSQIFENQVGYKPRILKMHAGLETGLFAEKNDKLDIISIGPDIKNPHTPSEKMSIEAVEQTYVYLVSALENYNIVK
ncbi:beta-Ala-His dipeptidase [Oceanivirga miroungae]|uniref:Cytosol non-specific dipeptidase n=1 Tax=Oceanivirga miroungae TaxID=1130046 RepID=A0A6I8M8L8_9FUSO|nr:beta-Ala-His dipeptidase [Oceanivirga miroungae]VWL85833.1 aminoacyl-histidine dipeptidase [Oceanivirga miroungae]